MASLRRVGCTAAAPMRPPRPAEYPPARLLLPAPSQCGRHRLRTRFRSARSRRVRNPPRAQRSRHSSMLESGSRTTAPSGVPSRRTRDRAPAGKPRTLDPRHGAVVAAGRDHESCGRRDTPRRPDRRAMGSRCHRMAGIESSKRGRRSRRYTVFFQTETCEVLSLVKGSRVQPLQRSRKVMPAIRAIRSSSAGHT